MKCNFLLDLRYQTIAYFTSFTRFVGKIKYHLDNENISRIFSIKTFVYHYSHFVIFLSRNIRIRISSTTRECSLAGHSHPTIIMRKISFNQKYFILRHIIIIICYMIFRMMGIPAFQIRKNKNSRLITFQFKTHQKDTNLRLSDDFKGYRS